MAAIFCRKTKGQRCNKYLPPPKRLFWQRLIRSPGKWPRGTREANGQGANNSGTSTRTTGKWRLFHAQDTGNRPTRAQKRKECQLFPIPDGDSRDTACHCLKLREANRRRKTLTMEGSGGRILVSCSSPETEIQLQLLLIPH